MVAGTCGMSIVPAGSSAAGAGCSGAGVEGVRLPGTAVGNSGVDVGGVVAGGAGGAAAAGAGGTGADSAGSSSGAASPSGVAGFAAEGVSSGLTAASSSGIAAGLPVSLPGVTALTHSHRPSALMLHDQGSSAASATEPSVSNGANASSRMVVRVTTAVNSGCCWTGRLQSCRYRSSGSVSGYSRIAGSPAGAG